MKTLPPHCVPILRVRDARASIDYYEKALGFVKEWEHQFEPGLPLFVSMRLGEVTLFLSEHSGDGAPCTHVYFYLSELNSLHVRCQSGGARIIHPPQAMDWGMIEMRVEDLDQNQLRFGTKAS